MIRTRFAGAACAAALILAPAASAVNLHEFTFDDPNGTVLPDVTDSIGGLNWIDDLQGDITNTAVMDGVLRSQKNNDDFGTTFLDIDNITGGMAWIVVEIAGWNLTDFDDTEPEQFRMSFLNNDVDPGSTIHSQMQLFRISEGIFSLDGSALGDGSSNIPDFKDFNASRSEPLTLVLQIDEDNNEYQVFYKDGVDAEFTPLSSVPGQISPQRDANMVRMVFNNNIGGELPGNADGDRDVDAFDLGIWQTQFGMTGEDLTADFDKDDDVDAFDLGLWQTNFGRVLEGFIDVDRILVTTTNPFTTQSVAIPEPAGAVLLVAAGVCGMLRRR